ncbi:molybdopterin synthase sulfur carrier subunit [Marinobacterium nitratireducens]|uniref:Molybdopterin synthase sulfur carrier subunit n=1 Tax=Marinobacterium nitratireducens TaxID=518897 RepID=A0A917ZNT2_9GAMM|nr:molybdopterin converting factor subunit 1 [Marinobacterium nitratireducens]GGO88306.1 molybdopterin synthase sulfur carrier subunit [Marinobacterium nitratireducens]
MLQLVYFARVREQLGVDQEALALPAGVERVGQLVDHLVAERGEGWSRVLKAPNLLVAVNQEMVDLQAALKDGDEVAFFPPVTGG